MERLGAWITANPLTIIAVALILTVVAFHFAQSVTMQGMNTESMVGKESPLYQIYDHLYKENFGTESIVVMIEGDNVASPKVQAAMLRFSDFVKDVPRVLSVTSIADIVADTEYSDRWPAPHTLAREDRRDPGRRRPSGPGPHAGPRPYHDVHCGPRLHYR